MPVQIIKEINNILHHLREINLSLLRIKQLRSKRKYNSADATLYNNYKLILRAVKYLNQQVLDSAIPKPSKPNGEIVPFRPNADK